MAFSDVYVYVMFLISFNALRQTMCKFISRHHCRVFSS